MTLRAVVVALAVVVVAAASVLWFSDLQASSRTSRQAEIHLERGVNLFHQKAYPEAELELRQALRANRTDWTAPFYVGAVQIERGRVGMAVPYLERALALNPEEPKILNALGVAYYKLGRLDMAKAYFWASLDLDPTNGNARGLMETMARLERRAAQIAAARK